MNVGMCYTIGERIRHCFSFLRHISHVKIFSHEFLYSIILQIPLLYIRFTHVDYNHKQILSRVGRTCWDVLKSIQAPSLSSKHNNYQRLMVLQTVVSYLKAPKLLTV